MNFCMPWMLSFLTLKELWFEDFHDLKTIMKIVKSFYSISMSYNCIVSLASKATILAMM